MANTNIYPYGQGGELPADYPLSTSLDENNAQKGAASSLTYQLNQMMQGEYRVSETRTLTLTASRTTKKANYPLFKDSLVHFKMTLPSALSGATYLFGKVDNTQTGQKILLTVPSGETTAEADVVVDKKYNFLSVWNANDTSLASVNITLEVSQKVHCTGLDTIPNAVPLAKADGSWKKSIIQIPVKKGNVLYFCGYTEMGALVLLRTNYNDSTAVAMWDVSSGYSADVAEGFITFEQDGYVRLQSYHQNFEPTFILYANERLKDEIAVAANNTPEGIRQQADYFCTGTNDEVMLNEFLQGSRLLGKPIKLLRGDYWLDAPTKQYSSSNDTFLLVDTSPVGGAPSKKLVMYGENPAERPVIHISDAGYEALSASKQYSVFAVYDSSNYGGFVELRNIRFVYPWNQKKICAVDFWRYGGHARLHSIGLTAYTSGYNGTPGINIGNPPPVAAEGCIGLRFIGKGPNGSYGSEITDCSISGFNEGICINTEWCVCNHVVSIFCVTGWVFGKYRLSVSGQYSTSIHPLLLLCCGDERGVNLPVFYACQENQDIEMYAFTIERTSTIVPGGTLGNLARVVSTGAQGEFRGVINYTVQHHEEGAKNSVSVGFWEFGHGHGMRTTNMAHKQAGTTALRNAYRPNYMQRYFDTSLGKEIICVDESGNSGKGTWKDAMGNNV